MRPKIWDKSLIQTCVFVVLPRYSNFPYLASHVLAIICLSIVNITSSDCYSGHLPTHISYKIPCPFLRYWPSTQDIHACIFKAADQLVLSVFLKLCEIYYLALMLWWCFCAIRTILKDLPSEKSWRHLEQCRSYFISLNAKSSASTLGVLYVWTSHRLLSLVYASA